jgi:hypothetical protein
MTSDDKFADLRRQIQRRARNLVHARLDGEWSKRVEQFDYARFDHTTREWRTP